MTVKRKAIKPSTASQKEIERIIHRGGKTTVENETEQEAETRFTLRLTQDLIEKIDEARNKRPGNISRNQWIVETISEQLN